MDADSEVMVVMLTALNVEHQSVRRWLSGVRRLDHPAGTVFEVGWLPGGHGLVALAVTGAGNTAAAILAERAIAIFQPRALLFVGVAGALSDEIQLGDVIVATKVYAYHGGAAQPDGFQPRPRSWEIPHQLDQIARHVYRTGSWAALLSPTLRSSVPAVHFRPIAAGEVVLNARTSPLFRQLRRTFGDAAAIEMESAGVSQAAHLNDSLPVLTIRGISDKADGAKYTADAAGWQPVAAANAAAFALAVAVEVCATPAAGRKRIATASPRRPRAEVSVDDAVPRQLPTRGGRLVGRTRHLARLDEALLGSDEQQPRIAVLTGMAGAGKTALASHWAHNAADAFPDGLLYMDVRGFGPDPPLPSREIVAGFLRAMGQSRAAERGALDERAARLRTVLSGRRVLVFLDNVESVEQVRPLLPGTGSCAVLITSRQRLRGLAVQYGAEVVEVDRLSADDSVALLRIAIGDRTVMQPRDVAWLADRCGGLPLALRIIAEAVISRPFHDLASFVQELDDDATALDMLDTGDDPYSAVRTVFSWSYRGLASAAATAFRRLSLHPGNSFGLPAAAALLDASLAEAKSTLRSLTNAHLLIELAPDRFVMHDLLRTYARELSARVDGRDGRSAALGRLFDQYLHTADRSGQVIMPHRYRFPLDGSPMVELTFEGRRAALRWLDLERHNLVEICRLEGTEFDSRRWKLAYILRDYFFLSKYLDGWVETHSLAVTACERLADRRAEAMTRNNLGRALLEAGRVDAAAAQYRRARTLFEALGDEHGMTDSILNFASILRRRGAYEEALHEQQVALSYYRYAGIARKVGITLRSIARTETALGRLAEAAEHASAALEKFVHLGLDLDAAQSLNTLGRVYHRRGDPDLAETACRRAIEYSRRAGSSYEEARAWHCLGAVAADAGLVEIARQRWTEALTIFQALGAPSAGSVAADLLALNEPGGAIKSEAPRPANGGSNDEGAG